MQTLYFNTSFPNLKYLLNFFVDLHIFKLYFIWLTSLLYLTTTTTIIIIILIIQCNNAETGEGTWLANHRNNLFATKIRSSKEVTNYRPSTPLTTMYKTLTGIIAKRISTHLEEQNLPPAEQKGCHARSEGCKYKLIISKVMYEDCKWRNKNLSIAWIDY